MYQLGWVLSKYDRSDRSAVGSMRNFDGGAEQRNESEQACEVAKVASMERLQPTVTGDGKTAIYRCAVAEYLRAYLLLARGTAEPPSEPMRSTFRDRS